MAAEPIRLALVITELSPGGAERCLVELAARLDPQRYQTAVYSLGPKPPQGRRQLVERLAAASVATHFLDLQRPWHFLRGLPRLSQLLREQQAEIVQTFLFHANVLGARAARRAAGAWRSNAGRHPRRDGTFASAGVSPISTAAAVSPRTSWW